MGFSRRKRMGHAPPGCRGCLEAGISPPGVEVQARNGAWAHNSTAIGGDIGNAAPDPHQPRAAEEGHDVDEFGRELGDAQRAATLRVTCHRFCITTHDDLALVGLTGIGVTKVQVGEFHWNGKVEGREFQTTLFGGGSKGLTVDEGELTPESTFLQQQIERRLDPNTKSVAGPLMEMLEVVIAETSISPLLKAFLHREIVDLMKKKPASWGVALSNQLLQDYDSLVGMVKIRIRPTDWMDKKANEGLSSNLAQFYRRIGKRDYFPEAKFTLGVLESLQKIEFSYVGHLDIDGQARFNGTKPKVFWGLSGSDGGIQLSNAVNNSSLPYTPLVGTTPKLELILAQNYSSANIASGKFGDVEEFLPIDFSN